MRPATIYPTNLPKLSRFSEETPDHDDGSADFSGEYKRHAHLSRWTAAGDVKRLQFEVHLIRRALKMYDSLPAETRTDYETAKEA